MPEFQFKLGDLVQFKTAGASKIPGVKWPNPFLVVERLKQECPGGVQLHYQIKGPGSVAGSVASGGRAVEDVLEIEIEPYQKPDPKDYRRASWSDIQAAKDEPE